MLTDPETQCPRLDSAVFQWSDLPAEVSTWWRWASNGADAIQHTIDYTDAFASAVGMNRVYVAIHDGLLSAFLDEDDRASCLFGRVPALGPLGKADLCGMATMVRDALRSPIVYFPHVHNRLSPRFRSWRRRACPIVSWAQRGSDIPARVRRRYGSRAARQWLRFEAEGLTIARPAGIDAVKALDVIERRSWKAECGQSMHDRGRQFELYSGLLTRGLVSLDVAWDGQRPIAYRMDTRRGSNVACLKWSFDEEYRRCSPGFYLLTHGLVRRWGQEPLGAIDLAGSPDTLKDLVASDAIPRYDLAWPPGAAADALCTERLVFDRTTETNYLAGRGVRHLYLGSTG
jgi:hypothetical protein